MLLSQEFVIEMALTMRTVGRTYNLRAKEQVQLMGQPAVTSSQWPPPAGATSGNNGSRSMPLLPDSAPAKVAALHTVSLPQWSSTTEQNLVKLLFFNYSRGLPKSTLVRRTFITSRTLDTKKSTKRHFQSAWKKGVGMDVKQNNSHTYFINIFKLILVDSYALANTYIHCCFIVISNGKIIFFLVRCFNTLLAESVRSCILFSAWALLGRPSGPDAGCSHPLWTAAPSTGLSRLVTYQDISLRSWTCLILKE